MKKQLLVALLVGLIGCGQKKEEPKAETTPKAENKTQTMSQKDETQKEATVAPIKDSMSLLVAESTFKANDKGKFTVPDKAALLILKAERGKWKVEQIEDTQSNVIHKALPFSDKQILTIGGNAAMLKLWSETDGKWTSETLWNPIFGGKQNRLRDFETADFDGDGRNDLAVVTHDQGVVAVVFQRDGKWEPLEIDRTPNTFVHEVEVGDLDKNGKLEIYATPSMPNTVSGKDQGGKILKFEWNGRGFDKSVVATFDKRHVKEVYVKDVDGDGKDELYAAVEAEVDGPTIIAPVEIRRYDLVDGKFTSTLVSTLDDRFCRFLTSGDLDKDGKNELVAAAFSTGVSLFKKEGDTYSRKTIDPDSGGFEHAAYVVDLDKDGTPELYVADDKGGTVNRFIEKNGVFEKQVIYRRDNPTQAMVWNITHADF
jgi:hypothetical protein